MSGSVSGGVESGSDADFRAFAMGERARLFRLGLALTADRGLAEDLVQTALMRTYARWGRLAGQDPAGYAARVVVNVNVDRWRRLRGREQLTAVTPDTPGTDVAAGVADRDAVLRALAGLSVRERRVVVARFLLDLSEQQTAVELGWPPGTVKSVTHRAVGKLRDSAHLVSDAGEAP
jgi:RNA polymerase sigma-70 factor (sigma-E family)